jgi:hypothetical protein
MGETSMLGLLIDFVNTASRSLPYISCTLNYFLPLQSSLPLKYTQISKHECCASLDLFKWRSSKFSPCCLSLTAHGLPVVMSTYFRHSDGQLADGFYMAPEVIKLFSIKMRWRFYRQQSCLLVNPLLRGPLFFSNKYRGQWQALYKNYTGWATKK